MASALSRLVPALLLDATVAVVALAGSLAHLEHGSIAAGAGGGRLDLTCAVLAACSTLPLAGWRRFPLGVFLLTAASSVALAALDYPVDLIPGPTVALYLLVSTGAPMVRTATAVAAMFAAYLTAAGTAQAMLPATELLHTGLAWAVAWFAGDRRRLRLEQVTELRQRAVRAEREAERERLLAVAEERARIARDLHDSAGHAINVIAVRAGAARLRHVRDPERSLVALRAIEDLARETAEEIDVTVGSLRDGTDRAPAGLASLGVLIGQRAGLAVTVDTTGTPQPLGAATDQTAYRIIQEALTNADRHGSGGTAGIEVAFGDRAVELTITNPAGDGPSRTGGHGLIGMRERAALVGGSVDAVRVDGTFRVHARLPYRSRT